MLVAAGKENPDAPVGILVVILTPSEAERIKRGGGLRRRFEDIDPALGHGELIIGGAKDQAEAVAMIRSRFGEVQIRNVEE
jgi:hypothetical protein